MSLDLVVISVAGIPYLMNFSTSSFTFLFVLPFCFILASSSRKLYLVKCGWVLCCRFSSVFDFFYFSIFLSRIVINSILSLVVLFLRKCFVAIYAGCKFGLFMLALIVETSCPTL